MSKTRSGTSAKRHAQMRWRLLRVLQKSSDWWNGTVVVFSRPIAGGFLALARSLRDSMHRIRGHLVDRKNLRAPKADWKAVTKAIEILDSDESFDLFGRSPRRE